VAFFILEVHVYPARSALNQAKYVLLQKEHGSGLCAWLVVEFRACRASLCGLRTISKTPCYLTLFRVANTIQLRLCGCERSKRLDRKMGSALMRECVSSTHSHVIDATKLCLGLAETVVPFQLATTIARSTGRSSNTSVDVNNTVPL
jgi:hypothetical protein